MPLMKNWMWWVLSLVVLPLLILVAISLALQRWVHSDDFRGFVEDEISQAVGVPVDLGGVEVEVWPLPAVALNKLIVRSEPPLTLERVVARPGYAPLAKGQLVIKTVIVRNAVIPEAALAAIGGALKKKPAQAETSARANDASKHAFSMPKKVILEGISWVSERGFTTTVDASADFDDDDLPASAKVEVKKGNLAGAQSTLVREGDGWAVRTQIGGGTIAGTLSVDVSGTGAVALQGAFETKDVEIAALTAPARTLTGKLDATTSLKANLTSPGALADAVQTQTKFTVRGAVVHGLDLAAAVKSAGIKRGGETYLDALAGNVATQGRAVQLTNLVATSGGLSASGNVSISANKSLSGRITVDLTGGAASGMAGAALGIPLSVGGTLDSPSVSLSRGAVIGAAIGTMIAPGVGTGSGAKIGDSLGSGFKGLFGK